ARSAAVGALRAMRELVSLRLDALDSGEVARVGAGMTAMAALPPALTALLVERCGGSPLFVAEYLKAAVSEGILVRHDGRWNLDPGVGGGNHARGASAARSGDSLAAFPRVASVE